MESSRRVTNIVAGYIHSLFKTTWKICVTFYKLKETMQFFVLIVKGSSNENVEHRKSMMNTVEMSKYILCS